jgi:hypothetical protein
MGAMKYSYACYIFSTSIDFVARAARAVDQLGKYRSVGGGDGTRTILCRAFLLPSVSVLHGRNLVQSTRLFQPEEYGGGGGAKQR